MCSVIVHCNCTALDGHASHQPIRQFTSIHGNFCITYVSSSEVTFWLHALADAPTLCSGMGVLNKTLSLSLSHVVEHLVQHHITNHQKSKKERWGERVRKRDMRKRRALARATYSVRSNVCQVDEAVVAGNKIRAQVAMTRAGNDFALLGDLKALFDQITMDDFWRRIFQTVLAIVVARNKRKIFHPLTYNKIAREDTSSRNKLFP